MSRLQNSMIQIPSGRFIMGSEHFYPEERPAHKAEVTEFSIEKYAVTNNEFAEFVDKTGYVTTAEIPMDPSSAPNMPPEYFAAGSLVFTMTEGPVSLTDFCNWWRFVAGANWRNPEGSESSITNLGDYPVVQVSIIDALAYCDWAGKSLPTEMQWEFAARGGVETTYPWGDELVPEGKHHANTWQGDFPWNNLKDDGYNGAAPVDAYGPTGYDTYNMLGNVWEWTTDKYVAGHNAKMPCCTPKSQDAIGQNYVVKGGSFLCAPSYCKRYRPTARSLQEARSSTNHLGFRCVSKSV